MNQKELQTKLAILLEKIGIAIDEDLKDISPVLNESQTTSYIFFIRAAEIFKAISILFSTDADQVVPSKILLRSLSEYYVLLKSSVEDENFNSRHIKHSVIEKERWINKALKHLDTSGFKKEPEFFEEIREKTKELHKEHEKGMQTIYQMFVDRGELFTYLNVYAPTSMYVHGNRQSFNMYDNQDGTVKPTSERDYSSNLRLAGLATAQIMINTYEVFCDVINH